MYLFPQKEERAIGQVKYEIKRAYLFKGDTTTSSSDNRSYFTQTHTLYFGQNSSMDINQIGGKTKLTLKEGDTERIITEKDIQENPELR